MQPKNVKDSSFLLLAHEVVTPNMSVVRVCNDHCAALAHSHTWATVIATFRTPYNKGENHRGYRHQLCEGSQSLFYGILE